MEGYPILAVRYEKEKTNEGDYGMAEFRVDTDRLQQCSMQIQELSRRVSRSSSEVEAVISRLKMDGSVRASLRQTSQKIYESWEMDLLQLQIHIEMQRTE